MGDMLGIWTYNRVRGIVPQSYSPLGGRNAWADPTVLSANITKRIGAAHNKSAADIDLWSWSFSAEEKHALDTWRSASKIAPSFVCKDWNITADAAFQV